MTVFTVGQRVRSRKTNLFGIVVSRDKDRTSFAITGSNATYTVEWSDGYMERLVYPTELSA